MKQFIHDVRISLLLTLILAVVCCAVYPLVVYTAGQFLFPRQANGSLVRDEKGIVQGSHLIAQPFTGETYFHPRPSAAGAEGYDAAGSSGSNLGPTSAKLRDQIDRRIAEYRRENNLPEGEPIPADAVTASGSGLDPHISVPNARLQAKRVARARGVSPETLDPVIVHCTEGRDLGLFGEPGVNVLELNMVLDREYPLP